MTKKQKIIFKWTAYFILLIILNISLIFGTVFIVQDEQFNFYVKITKSSLAIR